MQLVRCVSRRAIARHPPLLVNPKSPISSPDQAAGGVPQCQATLFEGVGRSLSPKQNTAELLQSPKGARVQQTAAATRQGNRGTTLRNTSFCASTSHPPSRGISWTIPRRRCAVVVVACERMHIPSFTSRFLRRCCPIPPPRAHIHASHGFPRRIFSFHLSWRRHSCFADRPRRCRMRLFIYNGAAVSGRVSGSKLAQIAIKPPACSHLLSSNKLVRTPDAFTMTLAWLQHRRNTMPS